MPQVEIIPAYANSRVVSERAFPKYRYVVRKEIVDDSNMGGNGSLEMTSYYSMDSGKYIGGGHSRRMVMNLVRKRGLVYLQPTHPDHSVCSIGFSEKEQKWHGWSHRAICSFGLGDKIFEEDFPDEEGLVPFVSHGLRTIEDMGDAKQAAINFAAHVS